MTIDLAEVGMWLLSLLGGVATGIFFFQGLWWTVQRGSEKRHAALFFVGSFFLRAAVTLGVFYLVAQGHGDRFLWLLLGFVMAKKFAVRGRTCRKEVEDHAHHA